MRKGTWENNWFWAAGHFVFVLGSILYGLSASPLFYKIGYLGLCASLFIEVYRGASGKANTSIASKLFTSEASPYMVLSICAYLLQPTIITLASLFWYSLLNAFDFCAKQTTITNHKLWRQHGRQFYSQLFLLKPKIIDFASQVELMTLPILLIKVWSSGFLLPLVWASFLRWQYLVNSRMKAVCGQWDRLFVTMIISNPACPPLVKNGYASFKNLLAPVSLEKVFAAASSPSTSFDKKAQPAAFKAGEKN